MYTCIVQQSGEKI